MSTYVYIYICVCVYKYGYLYVRRAVVWDLGTYPSQSQQSRSRLRSAQFSSHDRHRIN